MTVDVAIELLVEEAPCQVHLYAVGSRHDVDDELPRVESEVDCIRVDVGHVQQPAASSRSQNAIQKVGFFHRSFKSKQIGNVLQKEMHWIKVLLNAVDIPAHR